MPIVARDATQALVHTHRRAIIARTHLRSPAVGYRN
jgi:hypothetical protein